MRPERPWETPTLRQRRSSSDLWRAPSPIGGPCAAHASNPGPRRKSNRPRSILPANSRTRLTARSVNICAWDPPAYARRVSLSPTPRPQPKNPTTDRLAGRHRNTPFWRTFQLRCHARLKTQIAVRCLVSARARKNCCQIWAGGAFRRRTGKTSRVWSLPPLSFFKPSAESHSA